MNTRIKDFLKHLSVYATLFCLAAGAMAIGVAAAHYQWLPHIW